MNEDELFHKNPETIICAECSGIMRYKGAGRYECEDCGHEELDNYGKVRRFIEKRGPSNVFEISEGTGIPRKEISALLKDGRLEVSQHSGVALTCARCGMPIRFGEYCTKCQAEIDGDDSYKRKRGVLMKELSEQKNDKGKMRFLGDN